MHALQNTQHTTEQNTQRKTHKARTSLHTALVHNTCSQLRDNLQLHSWSTYYNFIQHSSTLNSIAQYICYIYVENIICYKRNPVFYMDPARPDYYYNFVSPARPGPWAGPGRAFSGRPGPCRSLIYTYQDFAW